MPRELDDKHPVGSPDKEPGTRESSDTEQDASDRKMRTIVVPDTRKGTKPREVDLGGPRKEHETSGAPRVRVPDKTNRDDLRGARRPPRRRDLER